MNWKRNPALIIGLCAALGVSIIIIGILIVYRKKDESKIQPPSQLQLQQPHRPPPPQNLPQAAVPLVEDDYQTTIGSGKPALVMFYADWCGHSKNMLPAWEKVSQILNSSGQFEAIALEQKKHGSEMQKHGVRGFPDIRLYPDGFPGQNPISYSGNRTPESLLKFVQSGGKEA